jgi:TonB-dependent SusC/RagA subfamily outer membrane receptor
MKRIIYKIVPSILILFYSLSINGQEKNVLGRVTTFDSIPLISASIKVKSSKEISYSDTLGHFRVVCRPKDKLKVTARGFVNRSVKINEKTKYALINLKLRPGIQNRELAVGYGHVRDANKLYSVSSLNDSELDFSRYSDIYAIIRGRFPGVQIQNGDIIIRGSGTFTGNDAALLVVDGLIVEQNVFSSISTSEIASINILKDAATSAYGMRGANGVVIVETKRGR